MKQWHGRSWRKGLSWALKYLMKVGGEGWWLLNSWRDVMKVMSFIRSGVFKGGKRNTLEATMVGKQEERKDGKSLPWEDCRGCTVLRGQSSHWSTERRLGEYWSIPEQAGVPEGTVMCNWYVSLISFDLISFSPSQTSTPLHLELRLLSFDLDPLAHSKFTAVPGGGQPWLPLGFCGLEDIT